MSEIFTPEEKRKIVGFFEVLVNVYRREQAAAQAPKPEPQPDEQGNRLIPVTDWNDHHQWPTIGGLRHLITMRHKNGFDRCLRKCGKRLLISEKDFFEWVDEAGAVR